MGSELTERLRAVIATQRDVVAAGHDPDTLAQLVAERARTLARADGGEVEVVGDDGVLRRGRAGLTAGRAALSVPLAHGRRVFGALRVYGEVDDHGAELARALGELASVQLSNASDFARAWREGREDALTGLLNRRAYDETLERETARARRHGRTLSLCLFDLDDFKSVNDADGHLAGDELLRGFAGVLRGVRGEDHAFRIGGDEFALVLPETDGPGAGVVARRLRAEASAAASIGIASLSGEGGPRELHAAADADLYAVKRGRSI